MLKSIPRQNVTAPRAAALRPYGGYGAYVNARLLSGLLSGLLLLILLVCFAGPAVAAKKLLVIVAFGDSLTAGYGLQPGDDFPAQLEKRLLAQKHKVVVRNAGVSGDTSSGGRARFDWAIGKDVDMVILELGANDALRGIDPGVTRENLAAILKLLKQRKIAVLLTGMRAPPNYGARYQRQYDGIFPDLAARFDVAFYPFFLDGVAARPALNQADGIHPNAKGVAVIVKRMLPHVEAVIDDLDGWW